MAKVTFSRKELEKHISLSEKTLERISLFGTTVESLTKEELELEIPANRPDLLSMHGFIRAFNAFENKSPGLKAYKIKKSDYHVIVNKSVKQVRPYTACAVVKSLALDDEKIKELIKLQEKLHATIGRKRKKCAIGIYPLEKITFPVTFEARKPAHIQFTPLGMTKELNALHILQKHPAGKEYGELLKDQSLFPIFVDAQKKILSMPPIINSRETGQVTTATKDVFIECSGYDKKILTKTLAIVVTTLADMGGVIYEVAVRDEKETSRLTLAPEKYSLKKENAEKLLGLTLPEKELSSLLARMGHEYTRGTVQTPAWRADILHEVDLIEDIAIAYGYDKITPELPALATIGAETKESIARSKIIEVLAGLGFLELASLHFISEAEVGKLNLRALKVENSKTDYTHLRPNLFAPLLRTLSHNTDSEYPQHVCEIGRVFKEDPLSTTGVEERDHLIIGITPGNFTQAKQTLDYVMRMLSLTYELKETAVPNYIEGRTGAISLNNKTIGHLGEVHPLTLNDWKIKMPLSVIELDLEEIYRAFL